MSKERALLRRALKCLDAFYGVGGSFLADEIRALLAAEQRKPLSEEEIDQELWGSPHYSRSFIAGVRFAEKHHGISEDP